MSLFGKKADSFDAPEPVGESYADAPPAEEGSSTDALSLLSGNALSPDDDASLLEFEQSSTKKGLLGHNMALIVVVVVVGTLALWIMRTTQKRVGDDIVDPAFEAKVNEFLGGGVETTNASAEGDGAADPKPAAATTENITRVLDELRNPWRGQQVGADELAKNPFTLGLEAPDTGPDELTLHLERLRGDVERQIGRLTLEGVIGGPSPVAVIGGELYKAGDELEDTGLRVHSIQIEGEVVRFEHDELPGEQYEVTMNQDD